MTDDTRPIIRNISTQNDSCPRPTVHGRHNCHTMSRNSQTHDGGGDTVSVSHIHTQRCAHIRGSACVSFNTKKEPGNQARSPLEGFWKEF
ncbi:hypothetical protein PV328_002147 [Microctonus aethiopoides]|uniref:Uncharacterized protein n=1 Tax=Microctonus aethiopoides TaxID=144406 RepID=A0AA39FYF6_9HYME|nr:hypothetical protein PV328_002147 [Microctonus aethiopoides]